jgi:cell division protein FtsQ
MGHFGRLEGLPGWRILRLRLRPRTIAIALTALVVVAAMGLWVRDSPLVSVNRVTVIGATGPDASVIRSALITAARGMTTLNVDEGQLRAAMAPYPEVKDLQVSPQIPHGLRIRVVEQLAVAQVAFAGRAEAVSADGTLLGAQRTAGLPQVRLTVPPGGIRVTETGPLEAIRALAVAPYQLLARITRVSTEAGHGLVAQLRNGPSIYLGDGGRLHAKWLAASTVLADPGSAGAVYIDVTDPARPAAGAPSATATSTGASATPTGASATPAAPPSASPPTPASATSGG